MQLCDAWYAKTFPLSAVLADAGHPEHVMRRDIARMSWAASYKATGMLPTGARPEKKIIVRQYMPFDKIPRRKDKPKAHWASRKQYGGDGHAHA